LIHLLGHHDDISVSDLTARPRFGIKGPGSAGWLATQNIPLPQVNRHVTADGLVFLRLGGNDILCLARDNAGVDLAALRQVWDGTATSKGYSSWREEGWAWFRLEGAGLGGVTDRLCAVDLREGRFGTDHIAQTRFAHVDAVVFRAGSGFDVLFDITLTAQVLSAVHEAGQAARSGRNS